MASAILGLVIGDFSGVLQARNIHDVEPSISPTQPYDTSTLGGAGSGRKHLVTHKYVLAGTPRGMGASNEAGTAYGLHIPVQGVEVVLVLGDQLGVGRTAALDSLAYIENHQSFVPVTQISQPVLDVDIMQEVAGLIGAGLPAGHLLRLIGIADVDHRERAGGVIGQVDVTLINERAVDPAGDSLGELGDLLGVGGILEGEDDDPILAGGGALAGKYAVLAIFGGHDVVDDPGIDHHGIGDHWTARVTDVDGVHPVSDRAEIAVSTVRMQPELRRLQLERHPTDQRRRPPRISGTDLD